MSVTAGTQGRAARGGRRRVGQGFALGTALALIAFVPPAAASTEVTAPAAGTYSWTTQDVAPGVQVRTGVLDDPRAAGVWTVTVQAPAVNRLTGAATWAPLGDRDWACLLYTSPSPRD